MTPLELRLKLLADFNQARANVRSLKAELKGLGTDGLGGTKAGADSAAAAIGKVTQASRQATAAEQEAEKARRNAEAAARKAAREQERTERRRSAQTDRDTANAARLQKAEAHKLQQLAPQLTDIVTQLAGGQNPLLILIQQGGQVRDIFGGVGNAFRALGQVLTPFRVVMGGVAAALAAVGFAAFSGRSETDALRKSFALTGNEAGNTLGYVAAVSERLARTTTVSIGQARDITAELVASGKFTGAAMENAGRAVAALQVLTGKSASEITADLAEMGQGVADWALKHNKAYNYLTAAEIDYIRSLEAQGRSQEAMRVNLAALAQTLEQRAAPAVGTFEKAWNAVRNTLSGVWDTLKEIGREQSPEQRLDGLIKRRDELAKFGLGGDVKRINELIDAESNLAGRDAIRATDRAIALKQEQEEAEKRTRAYQDKVAALTQAGAQKRLSAELAALDSRQAAEELANARGVRTEEQHQLALNALDVKRLQAQRGFLQQQLAIEKGRVVEKPTDVMDRDAAVAQIEAQLIEMQGRIQAAVGQAATLTQAQALERSRELAAAWASAWQAAYERVRSLQQENAAAAAQRQQVAGNRAQAEADARVAALRQQLADDSRALTLRIDVELNPQRRAALVQQLAQLTQEANTRIGEVDRTARLQSFQTQLAERMQALATAEAALDTAVQQGSISFEDAEGRKLALRAEELAQLERLLAMMTMLAETPAERNQVAELANRVQVLKDLRTELEKAAKAEGINALTTLLDQTTGEAKSLKNALLDAVGSFGKAMLHLLNQRLAAKMVDEAIKALDGLTSQKAGEGGNGWLALVGKIIGSFFHTGGVVGAAGGTRRAVPAGAFMGAPRYHGGGLAGLMPGEVPAVLQVGEEVITRDDPRHVRNGGRVGGLNFTSSVQISGADGSRDDLARAGAELDSRIRGTVEQWAGEQQRPGGVLYGRG